MVWRAIALAGFTYFAAGQLMGDVPPHLGDRLAAWHTRVQIRAAYHIALLTTHTQPLLCEIA